MKTNHIFSFSLTLLKNCSNVMVIVDRDTKSSCYFNVTNSSLDRIRHLQYSRFIKTETHASFTDDGAWAVIHIKE